MQISQAYVSQPANAPIPKLTYYLYDHLGNTRVTYSVEVLGANNISYTTESAMDYFPYGKALRSFGKERYLSTQHERDTETDFDYRGARFYDADVARFNSLDPLAADYAAWSAYNYVLGNPNRYIDPDGKKADDWVDKDGNKLSQEQMQGVKVYIFYQPGGSDEGGFEEQTMALYEKFTKKYGEGSVALSTGATNQSFIEDWQNMSGGEIEEVWLNYHGDSRTIELGGEGVISSAGLRTNETGRDAVDIAKLPFPSGDISGAKLQINSCHAADEGQFVNDGNPTIAKAFVDRFQQDNAGFAKIRVASGNVAYWPSGRPFSYFSWNAYRKPALQNEIVKAGGAAQLLLNHGLDPR